MEFFPVIIWLSVLLAGVSFVALVAVILHRGLAARREQLLDARRKALMNLGLECLEEPDPATCLRARLPVGDRQALLRMFADLLPKVRGEYAERVVTMMRELGLRDHCLERLRARAAWQRAEACSLLGSFGDPTVLSALERMLDDPDVDVRIEAARSLARHNAIRSVEQLLDKLSIGTDTRSLAALDIFRSLNRDAVPELLDVLEHSSHEAVKLLAVDALSHIGDLRAVPVMLKLMRAPLMLTAGPTPAPGAAASPPAGDMRRAVQDANRLQRRALPQPQRHRRTRNISTNLQLAIVQALSKLDDPRAVPGIIAALDDPAPEVRAQAAVCAGNLGAPEPVPMLERLLRDENWWVRYSAAEALYKLGEPGLGALWAATQSPVARIADIATGLLREKGLSA